jgi:hypothetical protein
VANCRYEDACGCSVLGRRPENLDSTLGKIVEEKEVKKIVTAV